VVSESAKRELTLAVELAMAAGLPADSPEFEALVLSSIKVIEDARRERRLYVEAVVRVQETAKAMRENLRKCASPAAPKPTLYRALQHTIYAK
jgi:hypothetical protein